MAALGRGAAPAATPKGRTAVDPAATAGHACGQSTRARRPKTMMVRPDATSAAHASHLMRCLSVVVARRYRPATAKPPVAANSSVSRTGNTAGMSGRCDHR